MTDYQADSVFLPVIPSFRDFAKQLTSGAVNPLKKAGLAGGLQFAKALMSGASKATGSVEAYSRKLEQVTASEAKKVAAAREKEEAAARKVRLEETRLAEIRESGTAKQSQIIAAENRLTDAQTKLAHAHSGTTAAVKTSDDALEKSNTQLNEAKQRADNAGGGLRRLKVAMIAVGAAGAAWGLRSAVSFLKGSIDPAQQFEKTMRTAGVTLGATGGQMKSLTALAVDMGAKTVFSAQDAGQAMVELAKGGLSSAQIKAGALQQTLTLATAGDLELGDAATYVTNAMNAFHLPASKASQVTTALAGAANASTASVQSLGLGLSQVSAQANGMGLSLQDTTAALAVLDNAGIKGSDAGTSLKTMLQNLNPSTKSAMQEMASLGIVTYDTTKAATFLRSKGIKPLGTDQDTLTKQLKQYTMQLVGTKTWNTEAQQTFQKLGVDVGYTNNRFFDAKGNVRDLSSINKVLSSSMKGLSKQERASALQTIFGTDASRAALILGTASTKQVRSYVAASKDKTQAEKMAQAATKGYSGAQEKMSGAVETLRIQMGTYLLPALTQLMNVTADQLMPVVGSLITTVGPKLTPVVRQAANLFTGWAASTASLIGFLTRHKTAVEILATGLVALIGVTKTFIIVGKAQAAILQAGGILAWVKGLNLAKGATIAWSTATKVATAVQKALSLAWSTSPIGVVIGLVALLVAALVVFFTKTKTGQRIWKAFTSGLVTAWNATGKALSTAWTWLSDKAVSVFTGIRTFFKNWGVYILAALGGPVSLAVVVVVKHWSSIKAAFSSGVSGVVSIARTLGSKIRDAFSAAGSWLLSAGRSIISGLRSGIVGAWGAAADFIGSIPGKVRGALAGAGSWLLSAGRSIISGLVKGITAKIGDVRSTLTDLTKKITDWKGPADKDRKLLVPAGKLIIAGLVAGITASEDKVKTALTSLTEKISKVTTDAIASRADAIYTANQKATAKVRAANEKAAADYTRSVQAAAAKRDRALAAADKISDSKAKARAKASARAAYAASVDRAKATKAANTRAMTAITKAQAADLAKKQLSATTAAAARANRILAGQEKTTSGIWSSGATSGTNRLVAALTSSGQWRGGTSKTLKMATLADLAKARENIAGRLATANASLQEQVDARNQLRDSVASSLQGDLDLSSQVSTTADTTTNFAAIKSRVSSMLSKVKAFSTAIKQLIKAGMPSSLVQEIAGMGVETGLSAAQAILAASKTDQKSLFSDWTSYYSTSTSIGSSIADQMYGAGISATQGLIQGLTADDAKLVKASQHLADTVVKEAKKALGIHSPSRVMRRGVGLMSGRGVALGLDDSAPEVARSASRLLSPQMVVNPQLTMGAQSRYITAPGVGSGSGSGAVRLDDDSVSRVASAILAGAQLVARHEAAPANQVLGSLQRVSRQGVA